MSYRGELRGSSCLVPFLSFRHAGLPLTLPPSRRLPLDSCPPTLPSAVRAEFFIPQRRAVRIFFVADFKVDPHHGPVFFGGGGIPYGRKLTLGVSPRSREELDPFWCAPGSLLISRGHVVCDDFWRKGRYGLGVRRFPSLNRLFRF